jgi:MSHA biogenesis protein MshJ
MIKSWKVLSTRIDALSLRERAFLFLSLIGVCVALVDLLSFAPARTAYQQAQQRFSQENLELKRLRDELQAKVVQPDAARAASDEIKQLNVSIAAANREISALSIASDDAMTLPKVLVHFLRRQNGLTLVRTSSLSTDVVAGVSQGAVAGSVGPSATVRSGLELTVSGPYLELVRYVQTLENAMPTLRWGTFKLMADQQPPELSLQVFFVGPQP